MTVLSPPLASAELAAEADARLARASAHEIVGWAAATFGERLAVATSMGDGLLAHLAGEVVPGVDVLFLDTGYHFAETLGTRDAVAATEPVRLLSITPTRTVAEQDKVLGRRLYDRDPDACCQLRKVAPLDTALVGYDAWISGVRREESAARLRTPVVGWDARRGKVAVHPLARWSEQDVERYVADHGIVVNPLRERGYRSIGCAPCTRAVRPGEDPRDARWSGRAKTECGIHR